MAEGLSERRLNSWKEIAAFFSKDERTVKRWETTRGLPVRRVPGGQRTTVFAYADELELWLGQGEAGQRRTAPSADPLPARWMLGAALVLLVAAFAIGVGVLTAPPRAVVVEEGRHVAPARAQELYLAAVYDWNTRTPDGLTRAVDGFTAALALDENYAEAHAGLANAYNLISQYSLMPASQAYPKARAAAERALALDANLPEAYAALAFTEFYQAHEFARSAELFEKALALNPDSATANHWYALTAMHMGDYAKPLARIAMAQKLDPNSRAIRANKALILFYAGRVAEALEVLLHLRETDPEFLATRSYLATIYLAERRYGDFLDEYEAAARAERNETRLTIARAARQGFDESGGVGMLRAMLGAQKLQFAQNREPAYKLALTAALLGENETALNYLDIAVERQEGDVLSLRIEKAFVPLSSGPRFRAMLTAVGLPLP